MRKFFIARTFFLYTFAIFQFKKTKLWSRLKIIITEQFFSYLCCTMVLRNTKRKKYFFARLLNPVASNWGNRMIRNYIFFISLISSHLVILQFNVKEFWWTMPSFFNHLISFIYIHLYTSLFFRMILHGILRMLRSSLAVGHTAQWKWDGKKTIIAHQTSALISKSLAVIRLSLFFYFMLLFFSYAAALTRHGKIALTLHIDLLCVVF